MLQEKEKLFKDAPFQDLDKCCFEAYSAEIAQIRAEIYCFLKNWTYLIKPKSAGTPLANLPGQSYIYHDPIGIVLAIGSWNYPVQLMQEEIFSPIMSIYAY